MRLGIAALAAVLALAVTAASAEDREVLSFSYTTSNDSIGEWLDRWRTSAEQASWITGPNGYNLGVLPEGPGVLREWRFRADIFSPTSLDTPAATDRRHAGMLSFGLHTHWARGSTEFSAGAEVVAVGHQTGLLSLQEQLHEALGFTIPQLDDFQIEDAWRARLSGEIGRSYGSREAELRPFASFEAGDETLVRAGLDFAMGAAPSVRIAATGHRVPLARSYGSGWSLVAGADAARVFESIYLVDPIQPEDWRYRGRAGARYSGQSFSVFYGLTWLSPEFEGQPEGQLIGTLNAAWRF